MEPSAKSFEVNSDLHAFRKHRHDVLNELQIVRGYLQLERPEKAVQILDRVAAWYQSITALQVALQLDVHPERETLVWAAAGLPRVHFTVDEADSLPKAIDLNGVRDCWTWLDEKASEAGFGSVSVRLVHNEGESRVTCLIQATEEISRWWNTDLADKDVRFGQIVLGCTHALKA